MIHSMEKTMSKIHYGIWTYDVPLSRKNLYNRLRNKTKKFAVPLTMSAYLIPYEVKETVDTVVEEANTDPTGAPRPAKDQVKSVILKFDDSEQSKLQSIAADGIRKIITNAKQLLSRRLQKAQNDMDLYEKQGKQALSRAKAQLRQAEQLSVIFALADDLQSGLEAFSVLLEQKTELYKQKVTEYSEETKEILAEDEDSE